MFNTYLKIAWRNLLKDRRFTLINLIGLSMGLTCALMIYIWISNEWRMDKGFRDDDRIWQVMQRSVGNNNTIGVFEMTPAPLASGLKKDIPEVQYAVTVATDHDAASGVLRYMNQELRAKEIYAGGDYFRIFSYPLLDGHAGTVLDEPDKVVISDQLARTVFHTTEGLVGKTFEWKKLDRKGAFVISGVFAKPTSGSTADFDLVFTFDSYRVNQPDFDKWDFNDPDTYVLLQPNVDVRALDQKLAPYLRTRSGALTVSLFLRKYSDAYLFERYENGVQSGGRITYIRLFAVVALFVLIIGCVNFMNLSTAKAAGRAKEVGVKKVMGARRGALAIQFITESLLMSVLATLISVLLVMLCFPAFPAIFGKPVTVPIDWRLILAVVGISFFTGLLAGSYPAFYLSGFNSARALKGKLANSPGDMLARKGLVIFQFVISSVMIISVLVVYRQIKFVQSASLGLNKDNVIVFPKEGALNADVDPFLQRIRIIPGVVNASNMEEEDLFNNISGTDDVRWNGKNADDKTVFKTLFVNSGIMETLGIRMVAGRSFQSPADTSAIIFNETAIRAMGLKDPVGKFVTQWGQKKEIVGVVQDFHYQSLYEPIRPCFLIFNPQARNVMVKLRAGMQAQTIDRLRQAYQQYNPGYPFDFRFMDEEYQRLYESENRTVKLSWYFAGMTVVISCLGLFGLMAFTAQRRRKEIGIRKVVGAGAGHILALMSVDILRLVAVAILVAFPLAAWLTYRWLDSFAYRVQPGAGVYVLSAALILLFTLLTISYQAIRSAFANPIESLRSE